MLKEHDILGGDIASYRALRGAVRSHPLAPEGGGCQVGPSWTWKLVTKVSGTEVIQESHRAARARRRARRAR